jgi:hypothetical protein
MKGAVLEIQLPYSAGPHRAPDRARWGGIFSVSLLPLVRHSCLNLMGFGFGFQYFKRFPLSGTSVLSTFGFAGPTCDVNHWWGIRFGTGRG